METEIEVLKVFLKNHNFQEIIELGRIYILLPEFFKLPGSEKKVDMLFCTSPCPRGYPTMIYFREKFSFKHSDRWQAPDLISGSAWYWFSFRVDGKDVKEKFLNFLKEAQGV